MKKPAILRMVAAVVVPGLSFSQAQAPKPPETNFVVLRSDVYTTETKRECPSSDGFFKGLCEGMKDKPVSRTSDQAVVVDAGQVHGYLLECRENTLPLCEPLTAGERLQGHLKGGRLVLKVNGKNRTYRILKSVYDPAAEKKQSEGAGVVRMP